jgi:hypothetical protein
MNFPIASTPMPRSAHPIPTAITNTILLARPAKKSTPTRLIRNLMMGKKVSQRIEASTRLDQTTVALRAIARAVDAAAAAVVIDAGRREMRPLRALPRVILEAPPLLKTPLNRMMLTPMAMTPKIAMPKIELSTSRRFRRSLRTSLTMPARR